MDWNQIVGFGLSFIGNLILGNSGGGAQNAGWFGNNSQNTVVNNPNTVVITNGDGTRQLVYQEATWTPNNQGPWTWGQQSWGNNYQAQPLWGNTNNTNSWLSGGLGGYNNNHTNCYVQPASYSSPQLGGAPTFGGNNWFHRPQLSVPQQITVRYPLSHI
jgi:hypothetical protein